MFNVNLIQHIMKKLYFYITTILCTISALCVFCNKNNLDDFFNANIEALARTESNTRSGRFMTVGCGGYGFHQWKTYCCPNSNYSNCPQSGWTCTLDPQYIFGCE